MTSLRKYAYIGLTKPGSIRYQAFPKSSIDRCRGPLGISDLTKVGARRDILPSYEFPGLEGLAQRLNDHPEQDRVFSKWVSREGDIVLRNRSRPVRVREFQVTDEEIGRLTSMLINHKI